MDGRRASHVVAVSVCDDDARRARRHGRGDRFEMRRLADTRIDQYRLVAGNQVGPIAVTSHWAGVRGVQSERVHTGRGSPPACASRDCSPAKDTANAINISTAALTYGVRMP